MAVLSTCMHPYCTACSIPFSPAHMMLEMRQLKIPAFYCNHHTETQLNLLRHSATIRQYHEHT